MLNPYIEAWELRELVLKKEIRPREVAEFFLARVEQLNPKLGAFITVTADRALADAARLEKMNASEGVKLPLFGVAYSLKDLLWTKDIRTTFGSKNLRELARARRCGACRAACQLGRNPARQNLDARVWTAPDHRRRAVSASAKSLESRAYRWRFERRLGFCGRRRLASSRAGQRRRWLCANPVGMLWTRGNQAVARANHLAHRPRASRWGGLSTKGPIARTVRDAALMLDAMAGMMPGDPYAARPHTRPFVEEVTAHPKKLRLAVIDHSALGSPDAETLAALESACDVFRQMGHSYRTAHARSGPRCSENYARVIVGASVAALNIPNPDLLDPVVRGSYEWGKKISAADYIRAVTGMHNTSREIIHTLMPYDALLAPTLTRPAVRHRQPRASNPATSADEIYAWIPFTFPFNSTGQPADLDSQRLQQVGTAARIADVGRPGDEAASSRWRRNSSARVRGGTSIRQFSGRGVSSADRSRTDRAPLRDSG